MKKTIQIEEADALRAQLAACRVAKAHAELALASEQQQTALRGLVAKYALGAERVNFDLEKGSIEATYADETTKESLQ